MARRKEFIAQHFDTRTHHHAHTGGKEGISFGVVNGTVLVAITSVNGVGMYVALKGGDIDGAAHLFADAVQQATRNDPQTRESVQ